MYIFIRFLNILKKGKYFDNNITRNVWTRYQSIKINLSFNYEWIRIFCYREIWKFEYKNNKIVKRIYIDNFWKYCISYSKFLRSYYIDPSLISIDCLYTYFFKISTIRPKKMIKIDIPSEFVLEQRKRIVDSQERFSSRRKDYFPAFHAFSATTNFLANLRRAYSRPPRHLSTFLDPWKRDTAYRRRFRQLITQPTNKFADSRFRRPEDPPLFASL